MKKTIVIPLIIAGFVLVIGVGAGITINLQKRQAQARETTNAATGDAKLASNTTQNTTTHPTTPSSTNATTTTLTFKDGSYSAEGSYTIPEARTEKIAVQLTIKDDKIESVVVTPEFKIRDSQEFQQDFASGISSIVVGKKLATNFDVSQVNGSSLTGSGFKMALLAIKTKAKA